jgi:hypothetical protein
MNGTFPSRSLSRQESRVVLGLTERGRREVSRREIAELLAVSPEAPGRPFDATCFDLAETNAALQNCH